MKKIILIAILGLLAGCGETINIEQPAVVVEQEYEQREDGGWCVGGQCYPPWLSKEEVEAEEAKKAKK